jgi:hypothetical protein
VSSWNSNCRVCMLGSLYVLLLGSSSSYAPFVQLAAYRVSRCFPLVSIKIRVCSTCVLQEQARYQPI